MSVTRQMYPGLTLNSILLKGTRLLTKAPATALECDGHCPQPPT